MKRYDPNPSKEIPKPILPWGNGHLARALADKHNLKPDKIFRAANYVVSSRIGAIFLIGGGLTVDFFFIGAMNRAAFLMMSAIFCSILAILLRTAITIGKGNLYLENRNTAALRSDYAVVELATRMGDPPPPRPGRLKKLEKRLSFSH